MCLKERTSVNKVKIVYDEQRDEISFQKNNQQIVLKMGEDRLNLLYQMTPFHNYKKFLFMEQNEQCAECQNEISYQIARLHHDPKLGTKGSKYIDFNQETNNPILCKSCHSKIMH